MGTGFLMPGSTFGLEPGLVFVTNPHVISNTVPKSLRPAEARVTLEIEISSPRGAPRTHEFDRLLFTSEPEKVGAHAREAGETRRHDRLVSSRRRTACRA